jgi:hypothetical protein
MSPYSRQPSDKPLLAYGVNLSWRSLDVKRARQLISLALALLGRADQRRKCPFIRVNRSCGPTLSDGRL